MTSWSVWKWRERFKHEIWSNNSSLYPIHSLSFLFFFPLRKSVSFVRSNHCSFQNNRLHWRILNPTQIPPSSLIWSPVFTRLPPSRLFASFSFYLSSYTGRRCLHLWIANALSIFTLIRQDTRDLTTGNNTDAKHGQLLSVAFCCSERGKKDEE